MDRIYFKCPNCGKTREVIRSNIYCTLKCVCNEGEISHNAKIFSMVGYTEEEMLRFLNEMNVKWGFDDKIRWGAEGFNSFHSAGIVRLCQTDVFFSGVTNWIIYLIGKYENFDGFFISTSPCLELLHGKDFKTLEEAKQACEEDFQKRKASNGRV